MVTFDEEGHLMANGQPVAEPDFFRTQRYELELNPHEGRFFEQDEVTYEPVSPLQVAIRRIEVPEDRIYVFGDNTHSSLDSRYWGGVPLDRVKGRAFMRYWPLSQMQLLRGR